MDPYIDIISDDHGEKIRKRVRERDDPDSEGRAPKRARANTSTLLSAENNRRDIEPSKPEDDLNKYDRDRLQQGLRYIEKAAKRKITPRTQEFLKLHKHAYKIALNNEAIDQSSQAIIQAINTVYFSASFYLKPRTSKKHDHLMCYIKLRQLEFLANYGDYLRQELTQIRADLKQAADGAAPNVREAAANLGSSRKWVNIADELADANMTDLRKSVYIACAILGINANHMLWLFEQWVERNRLFHNQIREYISNCRFPRLAEQICRDLKEILNIAPDSTTATNYEKVLLYIRNEYFDAISRDDPQHWFPNEKARKLTQEKVARDEESARK